MSISSSSCYQYLQALPRSKGHPNRQCRDFITSQQRESGFRHGRNEGTGHHHRFHASRQIQPDMYGLSRKHFGGDRLRVHGWTAFDVVKFMCKASKTQSPKTTYGYVKFIVRGSPMLRGLVSEIFTHISKKKPGKILITEAIPLLTSWYELTLNLFGVNTVTFHSGLNASDRDRDKLVQRFNDPSDDLGAILLPYRVRAMGVNLQGDCSEVVILTPAKT
jgi:hypothetical protein